MIYKSVLLLILVVVYGLGFTTESAAKSQNARGECKLWDIKDDYLDMKGGCGLESRDTKGGKEYVVTFNNGKEFRFIPQGSTYKVKMPKEWASNPGYVSDRGSKIIFEWAKWKLIADNIKSSNSNAYYEESDDQNASVRAGQGKFDATGKIPCAQYKGQPMAQCNFGVARDGGGTATVVVTKPDGMKRAIFFQNGKAISADTSQAEGYPKFSANKESGLFMIRVGDERYEIPDTVIYGG